MEERRKGRRKERKKITKQNCSLLRRTPREQTDTRYLDINKGGEKRGLGGEESEERKDDQRERDYKDKARSYYTFIYDRKPPSQASALFHEAAEAALLYVEYSRHLVKIGVSKG